ncbi:hypothetical protein AG1IA_03656 [Rhizoctonia solani AG-1 IA]|uniref:Uncharacterized protein n=1 Tax=Thanatephorus cucumeris (strain AG1-IA) TaxID=983506 RepID=L8WW69_THACA|nr:hypothetical protein AG1IA_03656 [Rhizoctonia solani AG-1 IA]
MGLVESRAALVAARNDIIGAAEDRLGTGFSRLSTCFGHVIRGAIHLWYCTMCSNQGGAADRSKPLWQPGARMQAAVQDSVYKSKCVASGQGLQDLATTPLGISLPLGTIYVEFMS